MVGFSPREDRLVEAKVASFLVPGRRDDDDDDNAAAADDDDGLVPPMRSSDGWEGLRRWRGVVGVKMGFSGWGMYEAEGCAPVSLG